MSQCIQLIAKTTSTTPSFAHLDENMIACLSVLPIFVAIVAVTAGLVTNAANLDPWRLLPVISTTRHCYCSTLIPIIVAIVVVTAGLVTDAANLAPRGLLLLVLLLPPMITCTQPT